MTVGLQRSGDLLAAFEHCQKLIDLETDLLPLDTVAKSLSVRRDRWIQAQLASIGMEAKGETAEKIDTAIRDSISNGHSLGSIESLQRFLAYFGNQPIAAEARAELVRKLIQSRRLLEAEMALWESIPSPDLAANAPALAEVAEMLRADGQAANRPLRLTTGSCRRFGNVVCREGKTAEQLIKDLPADDAILELLDRKDPWPVGNVENALISEGRQRTT